MVMSVFMCALQGQAGAATPPPLRIGKRAAEYEATTVNEAAVARVKKEGLLTKAGQATYRFDVPRTGWYTLYVQGAPWATDLSLDGRFLIHTPFESGVWEPGDALGPDGAWKPSPKGASKTLNLYLAEGSHELTFSRPYHPGLPYLRGFYLQPAADLSGRVRLTPDTDYLVFRRGEPFSATLLAGGSEKPETVIVRVREAEGGELVTEQRREVPAGTTNIQATLVLPTDTGGVFDVAVRDTAGKHVARTMQYCVVDTRKPEFPESLRTEPVEIIDAAAREPDYTRGPTRVVRTPAGAYRESGDIGRERGTQQASWFAYTLNLPETQADYVMRIAYPDDDRRGTAIVLAERNAHPMPAQGYSTGGVYPLSGAMQTQDFYFTARDRDPRVMFYNWNTGQRAACATITVHRIRGGFPALRYGPEGRMYGMYQEEPMRFLQNFGAKMGTDDALEWPNFKNTAERVGQRLNYAGINLWFPTIAVYGNMLWPGKAIPGYQIGILPPGPAARKEPLRKDVLRLMLLTAEKYGLNVIGDLHMYDVQLDERFAAEAGLDTGGRPGPWVTVSRTGEAGTRGPHRPYYSPLYPGVQDWTAEVFAELAGRYGNFPAFQGLRIRLLVEWAFDGWQCFRSLDWGYEDYTVNLFEQETGLEIPADPDDPGRFRKRYEWLVHNHYDAWVDWRCRKIYAYHKRLAGILTAANPDLKIHLKPPGSDVSVWREAGIDPSLYRDDPSFVLSVSRFYPDRDNRDPGQPVRSAEQREDDRAVAPLRAAACSRGDGTATALFFMTNHEGRYATAAELGYEPSSNSRVYPDATLNPPGIHYLQRFANGMADGNVTLLYDGSHGYVLGQPEYLRPFLREYRALPPIGMQQLGDTDPAALWYGTEGDNSWFYVANRAWYPVGAAITLNGQPRVERASTGARIETAGNRLSLELEPYAFRVFRNAPDSRPTAMELSVPSSAAENLRAQIGSVERLVSGRPEAVTASAVSPEALRKAETTLAEARRCLEAGQTWRGRNLLLRSEMVSLYEALQTYPPGLMHRKAYALPPDALTPARLYAGLRNPGAAALVAGSDLAPGLAETQVLLLGPGLATLHLEVPFSGRYRIKCAFATGPGLGMPVLLQNGRDVALVGDRRGTSGGLAVSAPVVLAGGGQSLDLAAGPAERAGLLGLALEPVYRDFTAADVYAIGPFPGVDGPLRPEAVTALLETPYVPETEIDFGKRYERGGKTLAWVRPQEGVQPTDSRAAHYICLYKTFGEISAGGKGTISYAYTEVESPEARPAQLSFGADYWASIRVNGALVFRPGDRPGGPPQKGESQVPITLRKGVNAILLKIHAGSNGNGFWLSITDPGDLRYGVPAAGGNG
ncbi:MAG: family 10 glycosylhydrolase [Lentisphaerae bacterium]|nr:family 10 glycosylhydrolase [Lentisphaerota bacterium]